MLTCDGRVVCGCADPYVRRVLGDARNRTVAEIWNAGNVRDLRAALNTGGSRFCGDCPLKLPLADDAAPVVRSVDAGALPSRLYVECTAVCNISCFEACCAPETGITRTRQAGMLDFALFTRVIDEAGPALERVDFFNGLALTEAQATRLVHSGIDEVTFWATPSPERLRMPASICTPGRPALHFRRRGNQP